MAQSNPAQTHSSESGLDLSAIDKSASPCQDFYQYACGAWMKANPIPADEASWGSFNILYERNQQVLRGLLEEAAQHQERSADDAQLGGFYSSCMNEEAIEKRGLTPLQQELTRIQAIRDQDGVLAEISRFHGLGVTALFDFNSQPDPTNSRMTIANLDQGGLGLPERDFYLRDDKRSQEIRAKYVAHVSKMLVLAGEPEAAARDKAQRIMVLETEMAKSSLDVTSRRDPKQVTHAYTKQRLEALAPKLKFAEYFSAVRSPEFQNLNVSVPKFLEALNAGLTKHPISDFQAYLEWHYLDQNANRLSRNFVNESFDFDGRVLQGLKQIKPRWKRCVEATDASLGELLGRRYVDKTFGEQGKARTLGLVKEIERQMASDIDSLSWMSAQTKREAHIKLAAVTNKIGYPERWRDYSSVHIDNADYFGNRSRAIEFEVARQWSKIGKPVDRSEWYMTPPTVNAYYDPTENNINFPAGILQPPFYISNATDAVNLGAIGMVVGHELTHGFDDQGRKFDADGNLRDWWQKEDAERYEKLSQCFVNEYGSFSPVSGVELNGKLTLGENTADNGGMRLADAALLASLSKLGSSAGAKKDGFSSQQQFFLGFAQVWCTNTRPEMERLQAQVDPHSPPRYRVDGVVQNMPEFSSAFGCKVGDAMQKPRGCKIW